MFSPKVFELEVSGPVVTVRVLRNVASLPDEGALEQLNQLLAMLPGPPERRVLFDFSGLSFFGSSMLEAMIRVWIGLNRQSGRMALCGVSEIGREVLRVGRFDTLWPIYLSREEALRALGSPSEPR
jgi:anti-anti-sigma factor